MILFAYSFGFGVCIVNPGYGNVAAFCAGALLQRASFLLMLAVTAFVLPRARYHCAIIGSAAVLAMLGLVLALVAQVSGTASGEDGVGCDGIPMLVKVGLWFAAIVEFFFEAVTSAFADGQKLVPVNIEQSKERLGALELIMLGETVLSVTLTYRELQQQQHDDDSDEEQAVLVEASTSLYYWVLGLSFLLIFMFVLMYFHVQPAPSEHAFRRSRFRGTTLLIVLKALALALLTVGVSVKLVVEAVLEEEPLSTYASELMGISVGVSMFLLFCLRYLHHGGRAYVVFGRKVLRFGRNPDLDRIATVWWWAVGTAWVLPFVGIATGITVGRPLASTAWHAGLLFALCVAESACSHSIEDALSEGTKTTADDVADVSGPHDKDERQAMLASSSPLESYKSTSIR